MAEVPVPATTAEEEEALFGPGPADSCYGVTYLCATCLESLSDWLWCPYVWARRHAGGVWPRCSLLYQVFQTAFCFSVVSGCFVDRVSPPLPLRPKLALKRGLEGSELAFTRLKSARKVRAKSFGP